MATSLEQRNYIVNLEKPDDIDGLADSIFTAQGHLDTVPRLYLRAIVATTIHELGAPIRVRAGKVERIDEAEQVKQLAALDKVIGVFYPRVVAKASAELPTGKGRAKALNAKTNWARSAARDVRNWIRAGHSLTTLAPSRLIRAAILVQRQARAPAPGRIKARVERDSKALVAGVMELAATDKTAAIAEIRLLMGQLAGQLEELGVKATKDARTAAAEHIPLRVGKSVFYPTETQVMRQMEQPS